MTWAVSYYSERVKQEVLALPAGIYAAYERLLEVIQIYGPNLKMPHSKAMGDGLFELRPKGTEGIGRVFYCMQVGRCIVVLHSLVKKTQATPPDELRLARKRLKEVRNG